MIVRFNMTYAFVILAALLICGSSIYDANFAYPRAANSANELCRQRGFDFYESFFQRILLLPHFSSFICMFTYFNLSLFNVSLCS